MPDTWTDTAQVGARGIAPDNELFAQPNIA